MTFSFLLTYNFALLYRVFAFSIITLFFSPSLQQTLTFPTYNFGLLCCSFISQNCSLFHSLVISAVSLSLTCITLFLFCMSSLLVTTTNCFLLIHSLVANFVSLKNNYASFS